MAEGKIIDSALEGLAVLDYGNCMGVHEKGVSE
jgi:hypothetical protein